MLTKGEAHRARKAVRAAAEADWLGDEADRLRAEADRLLAEVNWLCGLLGGGFGPTVPRAEAHRLWAEGDRLWDELSYNRPRLYLRPWTWKRAQPFVLEVHRHLPRVQGARWAISVRTSPGQVVGCAIVGDAARMLMRDPATKIMDDVTMCVLRVAVKEGYPNACSMLYGAASRMSKASGADNCVTYTLPEEDGTSLRAAGWIEDGMTAGGNHGRPSRPRKPAVDSRPKRRWWAPWSRRVTRPDGLLPGVRDQQQQWEGGGAERPGRV